MGTSWSQFTILEQASEDALIPALVDQMLSSIMCQAAKEQQTLHYIACDCGDNKNAYCFDNSEGVIVSVQTVTAVNSTVVLNASSIVVKIPPGAIPQGIQAEITFLEHSASLYVENYN